METVFVFSTCTGQTETTGIVTTLLVEDPESVRTTNIVPVGRPIATVSAYVLDDEMRPVPTGVYGELFVATSGTARGYAANPAMTAERFVPNPFDAAGGRMYRTSDVARFAPDKQSSLGGGRTSR